MSKDLSKLTPEELGKLFPIKVVPYNKEWGTYFEKEKTHLQKILGFKIALRIEHFGSTSVPRLSAKPTIDLLVEIPKDNTIRKTIVERMVKNGYNHMQDHPTHLMFVKGYHSDGYDDICYHIHMGTSDEAQLWDRIYFRDYLKEYPNTAKQYENLKLKLAKEYKFDREGYTKAKKEFIDRIEKIAKVKYS